MPTTVRHSAERLSEETLAALESRLGISLPDDYRAFLLQHNGGIPRPVECRFKDQHGQDQKFLVDWLLSVGSAGKLDPDWLDIEMALTKLANAMPCSLLPAGQIQMWSVRTGPLFTLPTWVWGLIYVCVKGDGRGRVYCWPDDARLPPEGAACQVADSFKAFLAGLRHSNDQPPPNWVVMIQDGDLDGLRRWLDANGKRALKAGDEWNRSPLDHAVVEGRWELVQLLLEKGASVTSAFETALDRKRYAVARRLVPLGVKPGQIKESLVYYHANVHFWKDLDLVRALLDAGAKVNHADSGGDTPLHCAARVGQADAVRLLLERGAKAGAWNQAGNLALHEAARAASGPTMKLLIDAGEDRYAKSKPRELPESVSPFLQQLPVNLDLMAQAIGGLTGKPASEAAAALQGCQEYAQQQHQQQAKPKLSPLDILEQLGHGALKQEIESYVPQPLPPLQSTGKLPSPTIEETPVAGREGKAAVKNTPKKAAKAAAVKIKKPGKELSEEKLAAVEKKLGISLPEDYRSFLLQYNGGEPRPAGFRYHDEASDEGEEVEVEVGRFLSVGGSKTYDFATAVRNYRTGDSLRLPARLVPIAEVVEVGMLALSVGEEDRGKIYLCETEHWDDIEQDAEGTLSEKNIHQVADSFAEFLASLTGEVGHSMAPYELIEAGDLEGLRSWLDGDGQKMSRNPAEMMSLLNAAFLANHAEMAALLIERGASVVQVFNMVMRSGQRAPSTLLRALGLDAETGQGAPQLKLLEALLNQGANVDLQDPTGCTLLHHAARAGSPEAVRRLLARGAGVGKWDHEGRQALHHAVLSGNVETMKLLIDAGEDLYAQGQRIPAGALQTQMMARNFTMLTEALKGIPEPLKNLMGMLSPAVQEAAKPPQAEPTESAAELLARLADAPIREEIETYAAKRRPQA